mgnify:CR=1 FL=1
MILMNLHHSILQDLCEFELVLSHKMTMMHYSNGRKGEMLPVVATENGTMLYKKKHCLGMGTMTETGIKMLFCSENSTLFFASLCLKILRPNQMVKLLITKFPICLSN